MYGVELLALWCCDQQVAGFIPLGDGWGCEVFRDIALRH